VSFELPSESDTHWWAQRASGKALGGSPAGRCPPRRHVQILGQRAWPAGPCCPRSVRALDRHGPSPAWQGPVSALGGGSSWFLGLIRRVQRCLGVVANVGARRCAAPLGVLGLRVLGDRLLKASLSGGSNSSGAAVLLCGAGLVGCCAAMRLRPGLDCHLPAHSFQLLVAGASSFRRAGYCLACVPRSGPWCDAAAIRF